MSQSCCVAASGVTDSPEPHQTARRHESLPSDRPPDRRTVLLQGRRVKLSIKELKSVVGLGQPQVTKDAARVERSVAVAVMAYLLLLLQLAKQIKPGSSWSAFTLKQELAWEMVRLQLHRTVRQETRKEIESATGPLQPPPLRLAALPSIIQPVQL